MFLSYQTTGFGAQSGSANIYDTRLGISRAIIRMLPTLTSMPIMADDF